MGTVFIFGFAVMAHLVYGPYILEYSKIQWCFGALFRMLVGDFDYSELSKANGTITPVFFTLYIGLVYIVMLNIFVAILNEAYTTARRRYEALDHPKPQGFLRSVCDMVQELVFIQKQSSTTSFSISSLQRWDR